MMTNKVQEHDLLARLMEGRGRQYGLLSRLYEREVDTALLRDIRAMRLLKSTGNDLLDAANEKLARFLNGRAEGMEEVLRVDYAKVFFGNGMDGSAAAYPFESVHTSQKHAMMQGSRDEVLALYRSEGFDKSDDWKDGEDHVALELAFERILCERCTAALDEGDLGKAAGYAAAQFNFLHDHLLNWVPIFTNGMRRFAQTDFYRALADMTDGFLAEDDAFLGALLPDLGMVVSVDPRTGLAVAGRADDDE